MNKTAFLVFSLLLGCTTAVWAQDDPCASDLKYGDFVEKLSEQVSKEVNGTATDAAKAETKSQLAQRANADGLTGNRLDLLHRAFVALGLGQVAEEEGQLVFNFNPEALDLDIGKFSPRVIVHDPVLSTALDQRIGTLPAAIRQATKDTLQKQLGDLSDVEAQLRWTNASGTPDAVIQELASDIFQPAYEKAAQPEFQALGQSELEFSGRIQSDLAAESAAKTPEGSPPPPPPVVKTTLVKDICSVPAARGHFLQLVADVRTRGKKALTTLGNALTEAHFFDLADLIDGEPHFTIEAIYRKRDDAAGPDERSASLRYEFGNISYRDFKKWAKKNNGDVKDAASVQNYLEDQKARKAMPKFSLSVDYKSSPELRIPLAAGTPDFVQADSYKVSGVARGGLYFGGSRDRRLELDATYDDVSDDPSRQDRFVAKLSWVEKLSGLAQAVAGSDLVVTLVYADKPEFRGEVDKDLGLRFGLKWSLGDPKK
jgi:hypothetical protein